MFLFYPRLSECLLKCPAARNAFVISDPGCCSALPSALSCCTPITCSHPEPLAASAPDLIRERDLDFVGLDPGPGSGSSSQILPYFQFGVCSSWRWESRSLGPSADTPEKKGRVQRRRRWLSNLSGLGFSSTESPFFFFF